METKKTYFVLFSIIFLVAVAIRFVSLNNIFYMDDIVVLEIAKHGYFFAPHSVSGHPPLGNFLLVLSAALFGIYEWSFRLPVFFFALATLPLLYFYTRESYDKKTALCAVALLSFSTWHIYGSTTNIGGEGFLAFFLLLSGYLFMKAVNSGSQKYFLFCGIALGIGSLIKEVAALVYIIFLIYLLIHRKTIRESVYRYGLILLGACIAILPIVFIDFAFNNFQMVMGILGVATRPGYVEAQVIHQVYSFLKMALWISPLLVIGPLLWFFNRDKKPIIHNMMNACKDFNFIFVIVYLSFFIFYLSPIFDRSRYLLVIAPFLCVISAAYIMQQQYDSKKVVTIGALALLFFSLFWMINAERNSISYDQKEEILELVKSGNFGIDIGIISETSNPGFIIKFTIVLIAYSMALLAFFCIVFGNRQIRSVALILFIAVGGGYGAFTLQEFAFHGTAPNYEKVSREVSTYANTADLPEPIYLFKDLSMEYYLDNYSDFYAYGIVQNSPETLEEIREKVTTQKGAILFIDMPFIDRTGELWAIMNTCTVDKVFYDKDVDVGYVFVC